MSAAAATKPPTSHNCTGRLDAADQLWFARTYGCQLSSASTIATAMAAATQSSHRPGARLAATQSRPATTTSTPSGTRCSAIYPINRMPKTPDEEPAKTTYCESCGHDVRPQATHTASMLGGTVVTIERCPGCAAVLETDR